MRYDLSKQSTKVIFKNIDAKTPWPTISPDGKRIAVLRAQRRAKKKYDYAASFDLQLIVYNLDGTEGIRSKTFTTTRHSKLPASDDSEAVMCEAALSWSGLSDKILVVTDKTAKGASEPFGNTIDTVIESAIYDCSKDKWIGVGDVIPWPFNNMPTCPNSKGFLVFRKTSLLFVDWDGWISEFKGKDVPTFADPTAPKLVGFTWNRNVARLTYRDAVIDCNTETLICSRKSQANQVITDSDTEVEWTYGFKTGDRRVCLLSSRGKAERWLEAQIPARNQRKVLLNRGEYYLDYISFFPSPDGEKVAVRCRKYTSQHGNPGVSEQDTILVIDNSGEIIASLNPG